MGKKGKWLAREAERMSMVEGIWIQVLLLEWRLTVVDQQAQTIK